MDYAKIESIKVSRTEEGEPQHVLSEGDGRLALSTLTAHFPRAIGLNYKAKSKELFAVDKYEQYLLPPEGGWVPEQTYLPVFGPCNTTTSIRPDDVAGRVREKRHQISDLFQKVVGYFDGNIKAIEQSVVKVQDDLIECLQIQLETLKKLEEERNEPVELNTDNLVTSNLVSGEGLVDSSPLDVNDMEFESGGSDDDAEKPSDSSKSGDSKYWEKYTKELYITVQNSGKEDEIKNCLESDSQFCKIIENRYNTATLAHVKFKTKQAQRKAVSELDTIGEKTEVLQKMGKFWHMNFRVEFISPRTSKNDLAAYFSKYARVQHKWIKKGYGLVKLKFTDVPQLTSVLHGSHHICGSRVNLVQLTRQEYLIEKKKKD